MAKLATNKDLGTLLFEEGLITAEQLEAAVAVQREREKSIGRALVDMGLIKEEAKLAFLNKKFNYEIVDIHDMVISPTILTRITRSYAESNGCVPILVEEGRLVVAMEDPTNPVVVDEIKSETGMDLIPVLSPLEDIERVLLQYPQMSQEEADAIARDVRLPLWIRIIHPLLFWAIIISPLFLCALAIQPSSSLYVHRFSNMVSHLEPFDVALYVALGLVLWAIIVWEVDGLLFGAQEVSEISE